MTGKILLDLGILAEIERSKFKKLRSFATYTAYQFTVSN